MDVGVREWYKDDGCSPEYRYHSALSKTRLVAWLAVGDAKRGPPRRPHPPTFVGGEDGRGVAQRQDPLPRGFSTEHYYSFSNFQLLTSNFHLLVLLTLIGDLIAHVIRRRDDVRVVPIGDGKGVIDRELAMQVAAEGRRLLS